MDKKMDGLGSLDYYNIPRVCETCGGVMIFKGVGEYQCEDCGFVDYDAYGKVRLYIEQHRGATAAEIEEKIGVPQKTIRKLLREGRIEVAPDSKVFMRCEVCGKEIRSGRFCPECEVKVHHVLEDQQREAQRKNKHGVAIGGKGEGEDGQKRFIRQE